jgi:putative acetyltransferase
MLKPRRNPPLEIPDPAFTLRRYQPADEDAAVELWRRTWQLVYPGIDFAQRLEWWRQRWRNDLVPSTTIVIAEMRGQIAGFVTVDPESLDLDQIVVASEAWGSGVAPALLAEAKRISPCGLDLHVNKDNCRAIRFYEKQGFSISAEALNWRSGAPVLKMSWRPQAPR